MSTTGLQAVAPTPPDSCPGTPLTPPPSKAEDRRTQVDQILDEVFAQSRGVSFHSCPFSLSVDEHGDLLRRIEKESVSFQDFWYHKLRYDYFPSTSVFILRMPTATHEHFIESLKLEIHTQLQKLASADSPTSDFAREIKSRGSSSLYLSNEYGRHDPDSSFGHTEAKFPGVILEVSYSQKRRDLRRLAEDYILGSDANINAVVAFDIDYQSKGANKPSKKATFSVWRPKIIGDEIQGELTADEEPSEIEIRDADGMINPSPNVGFCLHLDDFAPKDLCPENIRETIFISVKKLAGFLVDAEVATSKEKTGVAKNLSNMVKKRRRQSTPPEELNEAEEMSFRRDEERVEKRARKDDRAWTM